MKTARILVVATGILLPYLVRLPYGKEWADQYTQGGIFGWLFFGAFNAIAWGSILALSFLYRRPRSLIFPAVFGFGFLAWAHAPLDLGADAQAAIALIFIPIYAVAPILVGGLVGLLFDRLVWPERKRHHCSVNS